MHRALGHGRAPQGVRTDHCAYTRYPWPEWLMGETPELIDECLDWDGDDDGDHPVPAKI